MRLDEATLRRVHLPPYEEAMAAGALSIMISYSSWNGHKLHAHRYLLTDLLKVELAFRGFLVSDWLGVSHLASNFQNAAALPTTPVPAITIIPLHNHRS